MRGRNGEKQGRREVKAGTKESRKYRKYPGYYIIPRQHVMGNILGEAKVHYSITQDKTRQDRTGQGRAKQGETGQGRTGTDEKDSLLS